MYGNDDYCELAVRRIRKGNWVRLIALKPTAEFYGWTTVFPLVREAQDVDYPGGIRPMPVRRNLTNYRALPLYVCRSKSNRQGFPRGLTNRFRVTNNATRLDLAAIAQAIQIDYGWMTARYGERVPKCQWDSVELPDAYCHFDLRAADSVA